MRQDARLRPLFRARALLSRRAHAIFPSPQPGVPAAMPRRRERLRCSASTSGWGSSTCLPRQYLTMPRLCSVLIMSYVLMPVFSLMREMETLQCGAKR